jgi:hypothetical protein
MCFSYNKNRWVHITCFSLIMFEYRKRVDLSTISCFDMLGTRAWNILKYKVVGRLAYLLCKDQGFTPFNFLLIDFMELKENYVYTYNILRFTLNHDKNFMYKFYCFSTSQTLIWFKKLYYTPFQIEKTTTQKYLLKNVMSNNKWKITNRKKSKGFMLQLKLPSFPAYDVFVCKNNCKV